MTEKVESQPFPVSTLKTEVKQEDCQWYLLDSNTLVLLNLNSQQISFVASMSPTRQWTLYRPSTMTDKIAKLRQTGEYTDDESKDGQTGSSLQKQVKTFMRLSNRETTFSNPELQALLESKDKDYRHQLPAEWPEQTNEPSAVMM